MAAAAGGGEVQCTVYWLVCVCGVCAVSFPAEETLHIIILYNTVEPVSITVAPSTDNARPSATATGATADESLAWCASS